MYAEDTHLGDAILVTEYTELSRSGQLIGSERSTHSSSSYVFVLLGNDEKHSAPRIGVGQVMFFFSHAHPEGARRDHHFAVMKWFQHEAMYDHQLFKCSRKQRHRPRFSIVIPVQRIVCCGAAYAEGNLSFGDMFITPVCSSFNVMQFLR